MTPSESFNLLICHVNDNERFGKYKYFRNNIVHKDTDTCNGNLTINLFNFRTIFYKMIENDI